MLKKYLSILCALLVVLQFSSPLAYAFSGSGNGISSDPYIITSCSQLQEMSNSLSSYYELGNNINCSATSTWNSGDGFEPIGNVSQTFTGSFNGAGKVISNLYIDRPGTDYVGLFSMTDGAIISSIGLENLSINGDEFVGGVVGYANSATDISNVYTTGTVTANTSVGGVVGALLHSTAQNSYSTANITVNSASGGGFGGSGNVGIAENSFATGTVSGSGTNKGGLFGTLLGTVTNSYSVLSTLVGNNTGTTITGGSSGGIALSSFYKTNPLNAVYAGSPSWDFNSIWGFSNTNSLPIFQGNIHLASPSQSGRGSSSPPSCTSLAPTSAPDLFEMTGRGSSVTLYFAPASGQNSGYTISYGASPTADQFATSFDLGNSTGVVPYTINSLYPGTWYFKVRGQNGCMPGSWSQTMQTKVSLFGNALTTINSSQFVLDATTAIGSTAICNPSYTVKAGDSLWKISSQNLGAGTQYNSIMEQNKLSSTSLKPGQTLKIACK